MKKINKKSIISFAAVVIFALSALVVRTMLKNPAVAGDEVIVADTGLFEADGEAITTEIKSTDAISTEAVLSEAVSTIAANTETASTEVTSTTILAKAASTEAVSTEAGLVETEASSEHALSEDATIRDTIECNGVSVPLTESIKVVVDDDQVQESRWQVTELEENSVFSTQADENRAKTGMIDPDAALKFVLDDIETKTPEHAAPEYVNIVLVEFTDLNLISQTNLSKSSQTAYPVYLITVKNVEAIRRNSQVRNENQPPIIAISTFHYVLDAYTGDIRQMMAYGDTI